MLLYTEDTTHLISYFKVIATVSSCSRTHFDCVMMVCAFCSSLLCTHFLGSVTQRLWRDLSDLHISHGKKKENGRERSTWGHLWWLACFVVQLSHDAFWSLFCPDRCVYLCVWGRQSMTHMTKGEILAFSVPTNQKAKLHTRLLLRPHQPPVETDKGTLYPHSSTNRLWLSDLFSDITWCGKEWLYIQYI